MNASRKAVCLDCKHHRYGFAQIDRGPGRPSGIAFSICGARPIKPGAVDPVTGARTCDEGEACSEVNRDGECPDFSPKLPAQLPMIVLGAVACSVAGAVLVLTGLGVLP